MPSNVIRLPVRAKPRPIEKSLAVRTQEYIVAEIIEPLLGRVPSGRPERNTESVRDIGRGDQ